MPSQTKPKKSSSKKKKEVVEEVVEETDTTQPKTKTVLSKEQYMDSFDSVLSLLDTEVSNLKAGKHVNVKFLKSLTTQIKTLKRQGNKLVKNKRGERKTNAVQSGFLKPVSISDELRKFAGWDKDELHSRVDVTKFICDYIKEKDLQNPQDRRQIVPDTKLKKILGLNGKTTDEPLHYYNIQTHIKHHFS